MPAKSCRPASRRLAVAGLLLAALPALAVDGELDTSFSTDGKRLIAFDLAGNTLKLDEAYGVAVQDDGKVVVVGQNESDAGGALAWARTTVSGASDLSFGAGGARTLQLAACGTGEHRLTDVAIAADGVIWAAGWCETATGEHDGKVLRLAANDGHVLNVITVDFGVDSFIESIAFAPDGKVVVAGQVEGAAGKEFAVARLTPAAGAFDNSFSGDGKQTVRPGGRARAHDVIVQPDGKVIVVGEVSVGTGNLDGAIARLTVDGELDLTFGFDGEGTYTTGLPRDDRFLAVDLERDGGLVIAGSSHDASPQSVGRCFLVPVNATGTAVGFIRLQAIPDRDCEATDVVIQTDGNILLGGWTEQADLSHDLAVIRFKRRQGVLDPAFGAAGDGRVIVPFDALAGGDDFGHAMVLAHGKIVIAGEAEVGTDNTDFAVARLGISLLFADTFETGDTLEWEP